MLKRLAPLLFLALSGCITTPYGMPDPVLVPVQIAPHLRPHIHSVIILSDGVLRIQYVPGTITEVQIVASLQSYCAERGLVAYRVPGPTYRHTIRSRRGQARPILTFTVECR